ncbi:hypothetical protein D3C81_1565870 [compost metagenome]
MVAFAQLTGQIKPKAGALAAGGEEGFEQMCLFIGRHAGAVVLHFEDRQLAVGITEQREPDFGLIMQQGAVAPAIA